MPPDVREWLAPGHLAWLVIDSVAAMDLEAFHGAYRRDGRSRPAYEPAMMAALLLYAYARGMRSSRAIERACEEDEARANAAYEHYRAHGQMKNGRRLGAHPRALTDDQGAVVLRIADARRRRTSLEKSGRGCRIGGWRSS
jgi:transposase-like protein DUF772